MDDKLKLNKYVEEIREILSSLRGAKISEKEKQEKAIEIAALIVKASHLHKIPFLRYYHAIAVSLQDFNSKALLFNILDLVFRKKNNKQAASLIGKQIKRFGLPKNAPFSFRTLLFIFSLFYKTFYNLLVPLLKKVILFFAANFITFIKKDKNEEFISFKNKGPFNFTFLKEEAIGEEDVKDYINQCLMHLQNPSIDYLSIKISSLSSKIKIHAWEYSLEIICNNLRKIYAKAKAEGKFVNLDMESYKYLHLTVAAFKTLLEEKEFQDFYAGITLQAYLPDSYAILQNLSAFAKERVEKGGSPIKIHLVKGAYLSYEQVIASQKGWPQAAFLSKILTDANFKRMIRFAFIKENAKVAHVSICTHNVFDLSYALVLRSINEIELFVDFQVGKGRIAQIRAVLESLLKNNLRTYLTILSIDEITSSISFLQRRMEESIGSESILSHTKDLYPESSSWNTFESLFLHSFDEIDKLSSTHRVALNENESTLEVYEAFENESETDFTVPSSLVWQREIISKWKNYNSPKIPLMIGGREIFASESKCNFCPIYLSPLYSYSLADKDLIEQAILSAKQAEEKWQSTSLELRKEYITKAANIFRENRQDLIGVAMVDSSKILKDVDHEITLSIDLMEYYSHRISKIYKMKDVDPRPKGTIVIAASRAFPFSTSTGQIIAALLTGNTVIFKASPDSVLSGWHLVKMLWQAGIPKEVLQFISCSDELFEQTLLKDSRISSFLVSGAAKTVDKFLKINPHVNLCATSEGKNIIIITASADRSLAIKHLVKSAFTFSGQKYSSASLAILEAEVYDDPVFMKNLLDATLNLNIGSVFDLHTDLGPLMLNPTGKVLKVLTELEEKEEWLLKPRVDEKNPHLWSCGIKLGVQPSGILYKYFLPCPMLGIMRAENLKEAVALANNVEYGLAAGLESLDDEEHIFWKKNIEAGTLYINRPIIKAVIRRQPFGGCKKSSFGKTFKVGGPNYLLPFLDPKQVDLPKEKSPLNEKLIKLSSLIESRLSLEEMKIWNTSAGNYAFWWQKMSVFRDPMKILGQDNHFGYVPIKHMVFRIADKNFLDIFRIFAACLTCNTPLEVSYDSSLYNYREFGSLLKIIDETDEAFIERIKIGGFRRIRMTTNPSEKLKITALENRCYIDSSPVLANGRYELLNYLRELSVSYDYHRFGNLGVREAELRKPPV